MSKGKFGINNTAIAVIAFVFAALGNPLAVLLITGFALLAERDEWLNHQTVQALLLNLVYTVINLVFGWVFGWIVWFFAEVEAFKVAKFFSDAEGYVRDALYVALIALCAFAVLRVMKGKEVKFPLISKMAGGNIADALIKTARPAPQNAPPYTPSQAVPIPPVPTAQTQPQYAPPQETPTAPPPAPMAQATAPQVKYCLQCGASLSADAAFCRNCGERS